MQKITSRDNDLVKHIRKLKNKKYRDTNQEYIIEGIKLISEAIKENANIKKIILCDDCEKTEHISKDLMYEIAKYDCIYMSDNVFNYLSEVNTPQGILAIIGKQQSDLDIDYSQDIILALDDVQDPGNLGTILRTIDSIGLTQILVSKDTVDAFNPKVVRSTMGAIFRVKVIESTNLLKTLKEIQKHKFKIMVSSLQTDNSIYDVDYNKKVIVVGNEANGVKSDIQQLADEKIKIPLLGKTESLNVSVATGIILYEYIRQKL